MPHPRLARQVAGRRIVIRSIRSKNLLSALRRQHRQPVEDDQGLILDQEMANASASACSRVISRPAAQAASKAASPSQSRQMPW